MIIFVFMINKSKLNPQKIQKTLYCFKVSDRILFKLMVCFEIGKAPIYFTVYKNKTLFSSESLVSVIADYNRRGIDTETI